MNSNLPGANPPSDPFGSKPPADRAVGEVFVVFAREDTPWVRGVLLAGLAEYGIGARSVDDLPIGVPQDQAFEEAIVSSAKVLLILSEAFNNERSALSRWVALLAQHYGREQGTWPVVPIRLDRSRFGLALDVLMSIEAYADDGSRDVVVQRVAKELLPTTGDISVAPSRPPCPFPGLAAYDALQRHRFFGREQEQQTVVRLIDKRRRVALVGPSGSGKSSLLAAGVVPLLEEQGWAVSIVRPGRDAAATIRHGMALLEASGASDRLLVLDQFEEIFSQPKQVIRAVADRLEQSAGTLAVAVAMRADFYGHVMGTPWDWIRDNAFRFDVPPLGPDQMAEMLVHGCGSENVYIEAALVERLVADAQDEPGALPLLQETMVLLWTHLVWRYLPLRAYQNLVMTRTSEDMSGLQVALATHAQDTWTGLEARLRPVARRIFIRLVQFGEGRADVRRQQSMRELQSGMDPPDEVCEAVDYLVDARLLTTTSQRNSPRRLVDLAHEKLITAWPEFAEWLQDSRDVEQERRRYEQRTKEWQVHRSGLLDEVELAGAEAWCDNYARTQGGVDQSIADFIDASRQKVDADAEERLQTQRRLLRQRRNLRIGLTVAAGFFVIAAVAAILAVSASEAATQQRISANAQAMAASAAALPAAQYESGLLLAAAGWELDQSPQTKGGLLSVLAGNPRVSRVIHLETPIQAMAAIPGNPAVAVATHTDTDAVLLLDRATGALLYELPIPDGSQARSVAVSCDLLLALGTSLGGLFVWDMRDLDAGPVRRLQRTDSVRALAFHPSCDGGIHDDAETSILALGDGDGGVAVLDPESGQLRELDPHRDWVNTVAFTPDGATVLSGSGHSDGEVEPGTQRDSRILLHDLTRPGKPDQMTQHTGSVRSIDVSPDGRTVASSDSEGIVLVWGLADGDVLQSWQAHDGVAYTVAYALDGQRVFTGGADHVLRSWRLDAADPELELIGHALAVRTALPTTDGKAMSGGTDGNIVEWNLEGTSFPMLAEQIPEQSTRARAAVLSPERSMLALGDTRGSITVRDSATAKPLQAWDIGETLDALAFVGDQRHVVSSDASGRLAIWDTSTGELLAQRSGFLPDPGTRIISLASNSPDRFVAGDNAGTVWVVSWGGSEALQVRELSPPHRQYVWDLAFTAAGEVVAVDTAGDVRVWDLDTGAFRLLADDLGQLLSVGVTPDDIVVVGDTEGRVLWMPANGVEEDDLRIQPTRRQCRRS